jgi:hypothetical protein
LKTSVFTEKIGAIYTNNELKWQRLKNYRNDKINSKLLTQKTVTGI